MLILFAFVVLTVARAASASDSVAATEQDAKLPPGKVIIQLNDRLVLIDAYQPAMSENSPNRSDAFSRFSTNSLVSETSRTTSARPVSAAIRIRATNFDADAEADGWRVSTALLDSDGRPTDRAFTVKYDLLIARQLEPLQPAFNTGGAGPTTRQSHRLATPRVLQTWHESSGGNGTSIRAHLLKLNSSALTKMEIAVGGTSRHFRSDAAPGTTTAALTLLSGGSRVGAPASRLLIRARVSVPGSGVFQAIEPISGNRATAF